MIEKEKYTLFARDATGDIRHAAEVHGQTEKLTKQETPTADI